MAAALRLPPHHLRILAALLAAGIAGRVAVAFATYGVQYDIDSARIVADSLRSPGTGPYDTGRWPYPPGFFGPLALAGAAARATGIAFHGLVQLPAIAADAALAVVVAWALRRAGRAPRDALAGAALVALGPSFAIISGYHGQIDAVAILPAVLGALVWIAGGPRRAIAAGLLIGVGAAVKTVPLFAALALAASARDRREAAVLFGCAVAVPVIALAPWLWLDFAGTREALTMNQGVPGFGGLSAFLQPELTRWWSALEGPPPPVAASVEAVTSVQNLLVGGAVVALAALLAARRTAAPEALAAVFLTVLAVNPNFAYQYVVWALPFVLLAGGLRTAAALQAALLLPSVLLYTHVDGGGWIYWTSIQLAWLCIVAAWLSSLARAWRGPRRAAPATTRP